MNNHSLGPFFSSYVVRRLEKGEKVKTFNCGDDDLNDFIINEANLYRDALLAVSYVFEHEDDTCHENIAAYFSLANDRVSLGDFESRTEFNRFRKHRFVNEKRIKSYPAAKICRLAVSCELKGERIGQFLINFIKSYFISENKTGCRFLTEDAYSAAIDFYKKQKFMELTTEDESAPTRLLFFDLNDIVG